jgi:hypothetical protein
MVGKRRHIPEAAKQQWVTMSAHMKYSGMACVTHSNHRTINCILHLSCLVQKPLQAGCPHQLTLYGVAVSLMCHSLEINQLSYCYGTLKLV